jgi:hypothetical protein
MLTRRSPGFVFGALLQDPVDQGNDPDCVFLAQLYSAEYWVTHNPCYRNSAAAVPIRPRPDAISRGKNRITPLSIAVVPGHLDIVRVLT